MSDLVQKLVGALTVARDTLPHIGGNPSSVHSLVSRIDAALSEAKAGGWQPIETAPVGREMFVVIGKKHFPKTTLSNAWFGFAADIALATLQAQPAAKCDGNHGGPRCADPECWNDDPPEQPAAAEVSDAEIKRVWYACGVGTDYDVPPSEDDMRFARAILALRPQAVPMTEEKARPLSREELADCCGGCKSNSAIETWMRRAIAKFCEVNGITAPAGGEGKA